jgi:hypothetical protein
MENDSKNIKNTPKKELITRRKIFQIIVIGALIAVPGLHVIYRRLKSPDTFNSTNISIEGPFKEYGYFRSEDLGREDLKKLNSDFKLETLILDEGKYHDNVMISFTFTGKEDPNRKMKVFLTVYNKEGKVIGGAENIFDDPRILAAERVPISGRLGAGLAIATLTARLSNKIKITSIGRVEVLRVTVHDI